jgi:hypothetical protein
MSIQAIGSSATNALNLQQNDLTTDPTSQGAGGSSGGTSSSTSSTTISSNITTVNADGSTQTTITYADGTTSTTTTPAPVQPSGGSANLLDGGNGGQLATLLAAQEQSRPS